MEKYKRKIIVMMRLQGAAAMLLITLYTALRVIPEGRPPLPDYIKGFHAGFFIGCILVLLAFLFRNLRAWKNPELLKRRFVEYNDERNRFIRNQSGAPMLRVCTFLFAAAAVVAGFFNGTVFFTLLAATYFIGIFTALSKLYFRIKY